MKSVEQVFSDNRGNHILVALYFYDKDYKQAVLNIPEEYADINVIDINITKARLDKPINPAALFKMSRWLLQQFDKYENAIFPFICSTDDLSTNHPDKSPQVYRWELFDKLYMCVARNAGINVQDVIVGAEGFQSLGRAFYRDKHTTIIKFVAEYLQDKQTDSN